VVEIPIDGDRKEFQTAISARSQRERGSSKANELCPFMCAMGVPVGPASIGYRLPGVVESAAVLYLKKFQLPLRIECHNWEGKVAQEQVGRRSFALAAKAGVELT